MTTPPPPRTDVQNWRVAAHLSGLVGIIGIPPVVGPLVVWAVKRDDPDVEPDAISALNFHLSVTLYAVALVIAAIVATITIVGILLLPVLIVIGVVLLIAELVLSVVAAVKRSAGDPYTYPLTLDLIKPSPATAPVVPPAVPPGPASGAGPVDGDDTSGEDTPAE